MQMNPQNFTHRLPGAPLANTAGTFSRVVLSDGKEMKMESPEVGIVDYQVIVERDTDPEFPQGFAKPKYSIYLPAEFIEVRCPLPSCYT